MSALSAAVVATALLLEGPIVVPNGAGARALPTVYVTVSGKGDPITPLPPPVLDSLAVTLAETAKERAELDGLIFQKRPDRWFAQFRTAIGAEQRSWVKPTTELLRRCLRSLDSALHDLPAIERIIAQGLSEEPNASQRAWVQDLIAALKSGCPVRRNAGEPSAELTERTEAFVRLALTGTPPPGVYTPDLDRAVRLLWPFIGGESGAWAQLATQKWAALIEDWIGTQYLDAGQLASTDSTWTTYLDWVHEHWFQKKKIGAEQLSTIGASCLSGPEEIFREFRLSRCLESGRLKQVELKRSNAPSLMILYGGEQ